MRSKNKVVKPDHYTEVFTAFDFCILPTKQFSIQGF